MIIDDSRKVKPGDTFVAVKGLTVDGHDYINNAIQNGAKVVVGEKDLDLKNVKYIKVKDSRKELGILASKFYGEPSKKLKIIGVTGTDGKTTTSNLIYWILKTANKKVGLISTINAKIGDKEYDTGFHVTSPEPVLLQELLSKMINENCEYAVLEVTSHGLDQQRFSGVHFDVGVLTNITHEHLDYHKTFENYVAAKGKLFENVNFAVLNVRNNSSKLIKKYINKNAEMINYDFDKLNSELQKAIRERFNEDYNFENAAAAVSTAKIFDISDKNIVEALKTFSQLSGRMEEIENDKRIRIIVDFAHTPNALENVLNTLNKQKGNGKLIAVFGCASERDNEKRPMMAEIATRIADISIFTAEDPRREDINKILGEMENGIKNKNAKYFKIPERGKAIFKAINEIAKPQDIIVICGKGHEKSMNYNGIEYPWSDKQAVEMALEGKVMEIDHD